MFWNNSWQVKTHSDCMNLVKPIHSLSTGKICPAWFRTPLSARGASAPKTSAGQTDVRALARGPEAHQHSSAARHLKSGLRCTASSGSIARKSPDGVSVVRAPLLAVRIRSQTTDAARDSLPRQGNGSLADLKVQIALKVSLKSVIFHISLLLWFCTVSEITSMLKKAQIGASAFRFMFITSEIAVHLADIVLGKVVYLTNQQRSYPNQASSILVIFRLQASPKDRFSYINIKVLHTYHCTEKWARLFPITIHTRLFAAWRCPALSATFSIGTAFCCTEILAFFCNAVQNLGRGGN